METVITSVEYSEYADRTAVLADRGNVSVGFSVFGRHDRATLREIATNIADGKASALYGGSMVW